MTGQFVRIPDTRQSPHRRAFGRVSSVIAEPKKAIIIAAGMGRRLQPYTDHMPKCLVPVRGKPMIVRQMEAFRAQGISEAVVIRGYRAEVLDQRRAELGSGIQFVENTEFQTNNILQSLFKAADHLRGPLLLTYADIVFAHDVVEAVMAAPGEFALVVDRDFRQIYEGRTEHPLSEGEVCVVDDAGRMTAVGKRSAPIDAAYGEFIGLAKLSADAVQSMVAAYRELAVQFEGREQEKFGRNTWRGAYLTDLFEHLIARGADFRPVAIHGRWREIDTVQDLTRAEQTVDW
jgi:L-glutamine-phosphate cytidylyltransferase